MPKPRPVALIILDGWGIAPASASNAVTCARTPFLDGLFGRWPHAQLACFGEAVGLPEGQMGNSEVGHLNLGAGRVVYQDITRINKAIREGRLADNPALTRAMTRVRAAGSTLHFMGLASDGGVHSLLTHLYALIDLAEAQGVGRIAVHAFLDGRDTPPDSGAGYIKQLQDHLAGHPAARIASLGGRFWGMDRDKRWDRVEKAWDAMVRGRAPIAADPVAAVRDSYARGELDEFVQHTLIAEPGAEPLLVRDNDAMIFFNFRADRARELTWAFTAPDFSGFANPDRPRLADYVCMTQYDEKLGAAVAFPPQDLGDTLAEVASRAGLKQLHIAETEKYAHVTFFFNGGREEPFAGEDRVLVPSPKEVATYDQKPAMSAGEVSDRVIERIAAGGYDLIVMNYANGDMVGHTGVMDAAVAALETVDACLSRVVPAVLAAGGAALITADHGNAEQMVDAEGRPYTAHTVSNPVPIILVDPSRAGAALANGALCDVAPTLLSMLEIAPPAAMTGASLIRPPKG